MNPQPRPNIMSTRRQKLDQPPTKRTDARMPAPPQFIVDEDGKRVQAVVGIDVYNQLIEAWETLEDLKTSEAAYAQWAEQGKPTVTFEQVKSELRSASAGRKRKESA